MRILLSAIGGAGVTSVMQSVASSISGGNGIVGALGAVGIAAGAAAIGLGVTAVQAAGDFQNAMDQNVAHAGLAASQVDSVTQSIMQMAPALGQMPTNMATALYPILSSFSGMTDQAAKAQLSLTTLQDASKSVAGTTTDLSQVTNAATAVFNAYSFATGNAQQDTHMMNTTFDMMNTTVSAGNMKWADYSNTIGKLSVASHSAGVSFSEENAALATLTNNGYSAQLAGTYLSNTFNDLYIKADNIAKNAGKLGISFDDTKYKTMNLGEKIQYLSQVTNGNQSSLLKLMGGNGIALKTFDALSGSINQYQGNLTSLSHAQGATEQAFQTASSGFNFSMQKLQAAGQVLLITIGTGLLPILSNLASAVLPVITGFTMWLSSGQAATSVMSALHPIIAYLGPLVAQLGGAIQNLGVVVLPLLVGFGQWLVSSGVLRGAITGIVVVAGLLIQSVTFVINVLSSVIGFFEQNRVAANLLMIVLGGLVIGFIAFQVAAIAPLIPMFIGLIAMLLTGVVPALGAMAVAAWTAISPLLPFIAIGIAVAAVIFGIVWAITHWSQVVSFLQGVWAAFSSWFMGSLHVVGNFFASIWSGIVTGVHVAWDAIVNAVRIGVEILIVIIFGPIIAIGAIFVWLYQHNIYFKLLTDNAVRVVRAGVALLVGAWQATVSWLVGAWQALAGIASTAWGFIVHTIQEQWSLIVNGVMAIWRIISGVFASAYDTYIARPLAEDWRLVSALFGSLWSTYIEKPLTEAWNLVQKSIEDLGPKALDAGKNFINMLVSGITSGAGAIWNAVTGIASTLWKALGFHSPPEAGPAADSDEWMPNLIKMLSAGLLAGVPQMQTAAYAIAQPVASTLSGANVTPSASYAQKQTTTGHTIIYAPVYNISTMARSQAEVRRLVDMINEEQAKDFRLQASGYASGGVY